VAAIARRPKLGDRGPDLVGALCAACRIGELGGIRRPRVKVGEVGPQVGRPEGVGGGVAIDTTSASNLAERTKKKMSYFGRTNLKRHFGRHSGSMN
jgi:hypothetical protein